MAAARLRAALAWGRAFWPAAREYVEVAAVLAVVTFAGWFVPASYRAFGYIYLLVVIALSTRVGRGPIFAAAVLSGIAWNFVFIPPRLSFSVMHFEDALALGTYFAAALIGGQLRGASERSKLLAESQRLQRTLLDSVSHELKTPLAVVRSASERLDTADGGKRTALIGELRTATHRLDHLVANLLNQTRLEAGGVRAQLDWCDLRDVLATARRELGPALAAHRVEIEFPANFPLAWADAVLMEQVLFNLLLNAARYTPPGSAIRVSGEVDVSGTEIRLRIADNGPGLPDEVLAAAFRKFQRSAGAATGGLGLGLSIVRGFMLAQRGDVVPGRSPEGGACFTLSLPHGVAAPVPGDDD